MQETDFYKLSRPIQDGLLDGLGGRFTPAPILALLETRPDALAWVGAGAAASIGLFVLCLAGFGDQASALVLHPKVALVAYALLAGTTALGAVQGLACRARVTALPWKPGVFLFPSSLIDARDQRLRVYPLAELSGVQAGPGAVVLRFGTHSFSFRVSDASRIPDLVAAVEAARDRMRADPGAEERRQLDPLEPPTVTSPFASTTPLSRQSPLWERQAWVLAAAIGLVSGGGLFFVRNLTSDERMFAWARSRNDVAAYKGYAERGRRHLDEVSQVLLPRAELRAAIAEGSVEAVDAFARAYPKTGIQAEVDAARKAALAAELERAHKTGTLAAISSFAERYPGHGLDKPLEQARHEVYVRAMARYKAQMPTGSDAQADFVGRLLAYAERVGAKNTPEGLRGPAVHIRFQWRPSQDLERAEVAISKSPQSRGAVSFPSHHLTAAALEAQERKAAQALADGLARGFDPEILTFELGPRIEASGEDPPAVAFPTLAVRYRVEPSGAMLVKTRPPGIFMGLMFLFQHDFLLPGGDKPLRTRQRLTERIGKEILKQEAPPGTVEALIYAAMMHDAFDELSQKYLAKWFQPRSEGAQTVGEKP